MRRITSSFRPYLETALTVGLLAALVLGVTLWVEGRQTAAESAAAARSTAATGAGVGQPRPASATLNRLFQSPPPAPPGPPGGMPPAAGVGKSPVVPSSAQAPGKATATPIPDEVVLDLANNPVFMGIVLLIVVAVVGGFIWLWTRRRPGA